MLNEQVRDNEGYLKTKADDYDAHKAATSAVHGLGSGVYLVGCKQGSGRRIETKMASYTAAATGDYNMTVSWDNAFSNLLCGQAIIDHSGTFMRASFSTTQGSIGYVLNQTGTFWYWFLGIGT